MASRIVPRRPLRAMGDERLVALVRAGDPRAFEVVFDRHGPGLLAFCRHMLGSPEEAEDAVQHAFFAAHRALLVDERPIRLKAWLYAIARNRCFSMLRARREQAELDEELVPSTVGLAAEVERREDLKAMVADLGRLPDEQRAALVLSELGAHSHDEIAEVLGVKREKVKALVFQARESLAGARTARETPCAEIREQLASARGGVLRRAPLRRHLELCEGCRAFRSEVSRQRAALGIILPVIPSIALKQAVLAGTIGAGGVGAGGAAAGGAALFGAGGKGALAKILAGVLLVGGGAGGYVAVQDGAGKPGDRAQRPAAASLATADPNQLARVSASVPASLATPTSAATPGLGAASATAQPTVLRGSVSTRAHHHRARHHARGRHRRHAVTTATTGTTGSAVATGTGSPHGAAGSPHGHAYGRGHGKGRPPKPAKPKHAHSAKPKHARKPSHAKRVKARNIPAASAPEFAQSSPAPAAIPAPAPTSAGGAKHPPVVAVDVGGVVPALPPGQTKTKLNP